MPLPTSAMLLSLALDLADRLALGALDGASLTHVFNWPGWLPVLCATLAGAGVGLYCQAQRLRRTSTRDLETTRTAMIATEQRWRLLFEQSPLSIQIFAPDGQTMLFNQAWRDLFRLSDEQGYAFNVLKDPDLNASGAVQLIQLAFAGQPVTVPPVPFPVATDPPQKRWIGGVLYPVKDKQGNLLEVVTIHHDITEMKQAEEAMQSLNQILEQRVAQRTTELESARSELARALDVERDLHQLKSRFVSMVSHEFRPPLGVIMSAVELLRHYADRLPDDEKTALLGDIHGATSAMAGLMEQVLLLGRVEAGKLGFRPQPLDAEAIARKVAAEVQLSFPHRQSIAFEVSGHLAGAIGDETLLRHILGNLMSNALKYSPADTSVLVRLHRDSNDAVFEVRDHGIGIPATDRANLYEAFHRCGNVGDIQGTGLGLVIVKRCVDLHSGQIQFDSIEGQGTSFVIRIPLFAEAN